MPDHDDDDFDYAADDDDYDYADEDDDFDEDDEDDAEEDATDGRARSSKRDNGLKWALGLVTFLAIVATALAVTVVLGEDPASDGSDGASSEAASGIASANDDGPVDVITHDPTCAAWTPINDTLAAAGEGRWNERDRSKPASAWTPQEKAMYMAAAQAVRSAAAQAVGLVKLTPHRVMRELYEQFIAYGRAYAERIPEYTAADNDLAGTANSAASALGSICAAIADGSASTRGPLVPPQSPPELVATPGNATNPARFIASSNKVCTDWQDGVRDFRQKTAAWQQMDPNIPAILWNEQQKSVNYAAAPLMNAGADKMEQLGRRSGNATLQDFAVLAAQYMRAFVLGMPTYTPADQHLANTAAYTSALVLGGCATASI